MKYFFLRINVVHSSKEKKRKIHSIYFVSVSLAQSEDCLRFFVRFYLNFVLCSCFATFSIFSFLGWSVCVGASIECNRSLHAREQDFFFTSYKPMMDWLNENGCGNFAFRYPVNKCNICNLCRKSAKVQKKNSLFLCEIHVQRGKTIRNRSFMFYYWFSENVHDWCAFVERVELGCINAHKLIFGSVRFGSENAAAN